MLNFGAVQAIDFLPDEDARTWVHDGLTRVWSRLGESAVIPRLFEPPKQPVRDFDDLFELICGIQAEVGQRDVEFALLDLEDPQSKVPAHYRPLGNPDGQLMHTFAAKEDFVIAAVPALFKLPAIALASVAREIGRIALALVGDPAMTRDGVSADEIEGDAELAGVALGLGAWIANGAYVFENACCGGGCGVDLRSIRAGLSMPEACYATALDGHRKGLSRRAVARHLEPTQRTALKRSWGFVQKQPEVKALTASPARAIG